MNQDSLSVLVTETKAGRDELYLSLSPKDRQLELARKMVKAVLNGKDGANLTFPNGLTMSKFKVTGENVAYRKTLVRFFKDDELVGRSHVVRDFHRV